MSYQMFAISDEWQAEVLRARRAEAERVRRNDEALALLGYVSVAERLRSRVAALVSRRIRTLPKGDVRGAPPATAGQA